jgi:type I restriction enzyme S subunit
MMSSGMIQLIVDNGQLPVGWEIKKLGEVCTLQRGFDLPKEQREEGDYLLISSSGCIDTHTEAKVLSPGVVTGRSGSIGSVFFITENFWPLNTTLYVRDFHGNDPRFIFYLLNKFDLKRFASGVGVPTLNRNNVHSELVIIPSSITEQKRIVAILDEAFEGCDRAIRNTEKNLANARELFESYLNSIFTQKGDGWEEKKIEDVCESIIDCINKTAPIVDEPSPYKMIRTTNVRDGYVNLDSVRYVTEETYRQWTRRQIPQKGDVLLTREAPMGEVGMLLSDDYVFLGQRIVSYRTNSNKLNNKFLLYSFQSHELQNQIKSFASGSTVQHMRVPDTKVLRIAVPSLSMQRQVVQSLDVLLIQTQRLETIYRQKLAALKELKQSILQKAFTGELTADKEVA